MLRVRGVLISENDARELARRLTGIPGGQGFVDRLERALAMDGGLIGTDRVEAQVVLAALDGMFDRGASERWTGFDATSPPSCGWPPTRIQ